MFCSRRSLPKFVLSGLLAATMFLTACTATWIKTALADLPVLIQMAINISTLVSVVGTGHPPSADELAAINAISAEGVKDLTLIQTLYNQYKATPSVGLMAQIEAAIADANTNLPALLAAAHISDPVLVSQVTAGVQLILDTLTAFAGLIPAPTNPVVVAMKAKAPVSVKPLTPSQLKQAWNQKVAPQF